MNYLKSHSISNMLDIMKPDRKADGEACRCVECKQEFSLENTRSEAGWRETKISGMCENCWDNLFKDMED